MNKTMEVSQAADRCECGVCPDCMDAIEYASRMDLAIDMAKDAADLCTICGTIGVLTQGACYDCCRMCPECNTEPRSLTSLVCDKCLALTIKPVSNIPVKHGHMPYGYGAYININGHQEIHLMSSRQSKMLHLRHACHHDCGYCYEEAMQWLDDNTPGGRNGQHI